MFIFFVHGIVTDYVDDLHKQNGSVGHESVPIGVETNTESDKLPRKRWKHLKSDSTSVIEVSRGMTTEANTNEKPKDDHYPIPLKKPERLNPSLSIVEEEKSAGESETCEISTREKIDDSGNDGDDQKLSKAILGKKWDWSFLQLQRTHHMRWE